jgi:hypothetical protein
MNHLTGTLYERNAKAHDIMISSDFQRPRGTNDFADAVEIQATEIQELSNGH